MHSCSTRNSRSVWLRTTCNDQSDKASDYAPVHRSVALAYSLSAFNKISAKHFDFVLYDPASLGMRAVIEFNDKSHKQHRRANRHEFLRAACSYAEVPLIEVAAKRGYSVEALRGELAGVLVNVRTGARQVAG